MTETIMHLTNGGPAMGTGGTGTDGPGGGTATMTGGGTVAGGGTGTDGPGGGTATGTGGGLTPGMVWYDPTCSLE
jgi:hypothetical protein